MAVGRGDRPAIQRTIREALSDYGRGSLLGSVALEVGLDKLALESFEAAGIERATTRTPSCAKAR